MKQYMTTKQGHKFYINDTPGDQGTIIAVHGLTGNHKQFHHYQEALSGPYRFISYDVRGRGNSDEAPLGTSIFTHAEDLIELIDVLEIKNPILMGYSMGAYICALVASQLSNVKALVLLDGAGEADDISRQLVLPSLKRLQKIFHSKQEYVDEVKGLYTNLNVIWNDLLAEIVEYDIKNINNGWKHKSDPSLIEQDFDSFYNFPLEKTCSAITMDTFLLIATGKIANTSPLFQEKGYEKTRKSIRHIQTEYTPVNHYELVFNEQPIIVKQIRDFLALKGVE